MDHAAPFAQVAAGTSSFKWCGAAVTNGSHNQYKAVWCCECLHPLWQQHHQRSHHSSPRSGCSCKATAVSGILKNKYKLRAFVNGRSSGRV